MRPAGRLSANDALLRFWKHSAAESIRTTATHNPALFYDSAPFWFLRRFCLWRKLGGKASLVFAVKTFFNSTSKSRNTVILDAGWQRANGVVLTIAYFIKPPFCFSAFARQNNGS